MAVAVLGSDLASREDKVLGHLDGLAHAAAIQEARDVTTSHLVRSVELGGAGGEEFLQVLARGLQRVGVLHEQPVVQVGSNLQSVLHMPQGCDSLKSLLDHKDDTPSLLNTMMSVCRWTESSSNLRSPEIVFAIICY